MRIPTRFIAILGALGVALVLALGWFLGAAPLLDEAKKADADRADVEQQNLLLMSRLAQMKEQFDNIAQYEAELDKLHAFVPDEDNLAHFAVDVDSCIAEVKGAQLDTLTFGDAIPFPATAPDEPELVPPGATLAGQLFRVPVDISLRNSGKNKIGPEEALAFASCLQKETFRIVTFETITATLDSDGNAKLTGYLYRVTDPATIAGRLAADPDEPRRPDTKPSPTPTPTPTDPAAPDETDDATDTDAAG